MDDRLDQFLILVGDLCVAAARADLVVTFELSDATELVGVPSIETSGSGNAEVDGTGFANPVRVAGSAIRLEDIRRCSVGVPR